MRGLKRLTLDHNQMSIITENVFSLKHKYLEYLGKNIIMKMRSKTTQHNIYNFFKFYFIHRLIVE